MEDVTEDQAPYWGPVRENGTGPAGRERSERSDRWALCLSGGLHEE